MGKVPRNYEEALGEFRKKVEGWAPKDAKAIIRETKTAALTAKKRGETIKANIILNEPDKREIYKAYCEIFMKQLAKEDLKRARRTSLPSYDDIGESW